MKNLLWSLACIAIGIAAASVKVDGRTPWEHLERAWQHQVTPSRIAAVKDRFSDAVEDAKDAISKPKPPHEHHSSEDRNALNKLLARRSPSEK